MILKISNVTSCNKCITNKGRLMLVNSPPNSLESEKSLADPH